MSREAELAAEVNRLRAELGEARNRISALEQLVQEDPLVPVLNRRGFMQALQRGISFLERYGESACLVYLDLDRFKAINDAHGHAAGDIVLRETGKILRDHIRASDVIGRVGGDEFALLLWRSAESQASDKARHLAGIVGAMRIDYEGRELAVGASAGVAALRPGDTAETALARADFAMYAAKRGDLRR